MGSVFCYFKSPSNLNMFYYVFPVLYVKIRCVTYLYVHIVRKFCYLVIKIYYYVIKIHYYVKLFKNTVVKNRSDFI